MAGLGGRGMAVCMACCLAMGCQADDPTEDDAGALGDPCLPALEQQRLVGGYAFEDVTIERGTAACESELCLVHHFQGRVSCPYGQTAAELAEMSPVNAELTVLETPGDWGSRCRVPGTDGTDPADRVEVEVLPQKLNRRAADTVHCSCRCANAAGATDDGAEYCECPESMVCAELIWEATAPAPDYAGWYCIKAGTEYDWTLTDHSPECTADDGTQAECGPAAPY